MDERDSSVRNERILSFFHFSVFQIRFLVSVFGFDPDFLRLQVFDAVLEGGTVTVRTTVLSLLFSLSLSTYHKSIYSFLSLLRTENDSLNKKNEKLRTGLKRKQVKVARLEKLVTDLKSQVSDLESSVTASKAALLFSEEKCQDLRDEIDFLRQEEGDNN